ncbi:MAG: hypothetical protein Q8P10_02805 [bacterium]|nr:hypothetical protein [bacterium]
MAVLKKLIFILPFFLSYATFVFLVSPFLQNPNQVLSLDLENLKLFIFITISLLASAVFFVTFATMAVSDWMFIVPIALFVSMSAVIFALPLPAFIIGFGSFFSFIVASFSLKKKLANYLSFDASSILVPVIKQISTLLILILSFVFYLNSSFDIQAHGFRPPSSLINIALKFIPAQNLNQNLNSNLQISPDQIALLEQNPAILKQYGVDPSMLESLKNQKPNTNLSANDLIRPFIENQLRAVVAPYQNFIPIFLTACFFITLLTFSSLLSAFLPLFILIIFYLLETTNLVRYEVETREVNKLVV